MYIIMNKMPKYGLIITVSGRKEHANTHRRCVGSCPQKMVRSTMRPQASAIALQERNRGPYLLMLVLLHISLLPGFPSSSPFIPPPTALVRLDRRAATLLSPLASPLLNAELGVSVAFQRSIPVGHQAEMPHSALSLSPAAEPTILFYTRGSGRADPLRTPRAGDNYRAARLLDTEAEYSRPAHEIDSIQIVQSAKKVEVNGESGKAVLQATALQGCSLPRVSHKGHQPSFLYEISATLHTFGLGPLKRSTYKAQSTATSSALLRSRDVRS